LADDIFSELQFIALIFNSEKNVCVAMELFSAQLYGNAAESLRTEGKTTFGFLFKPEGAKRESSRSKMNLHL